MSANETATSQLPDGAHGPAPGLAGLAGRVRLDVEGRSVGSLEIGEGEVTFHRNGVAEADADAVVECDGVDTLRAVCDGELNPVVAALQDRIEITGNRWFGIRVVLGLQGSSPLRHYGEH